MKLLRLFLILLSLPAWAQPSSDEAAIRQRIAEFSRFVVAGDNRAIADAYTAEASILPPGLDIISGTEGIRSYWSRKPGNTTTFHKITPVEIVVQGDTAYDHGYYEVSGISQGKPFEGARGKYLIVWRKQDGEWKIHLDAWNRVN